MATRKPTTTKTKRQTRRTIRVSASLKALAAIPEKIKANQVFRLAALVAFDPSHNIGRAHFGKDMKKKELLRRQNSPAMCNPVMSSEAICLMPNKNKVSMKPFCDFVRGIIKNATDEITWTIETPDDKAKGKDASGIFVEKWTDDDVLRALKTIENIIPPWIVFDGFHRTLASNLREAIREGLKDSEIPIVPCNMPALLFKDISDADAKEHARMSNAHSDLIKKTVDRDWFKKFHEFSIAHIGMNLSNRVRACGLWDNLTPRHKTVFNAFSAWIMEHPESLDEIMESRLWSSFQANQGKAILACASLAELKTIANRKAKGEQKMQKSTAHELALKTRSVNPLVFSTVMAMFHGDKSLLVELLKIKDSGKFHKENTDCKQIYRSDQDSE